MAKKYGRNFGAENDAKNIFGTEKNISRNFGAEKNANYTSKGYQNNKGCWAFPTSGILLKKATISSLWTLVAAMFVYLEAVVAGTVTLNLFRLAPDLKTTRLKIINQKMLAIISATQYLLAFFSAPKFLPYFFYHRKNDMYFSRRRELC